MRVYFGRLRLAQSNRPVYCTQCGTTIGEVFIVGCAFCGLLNINIERIAVGKIIRSFIQLKCICVTAAFPTSITLQVIPVIQIKTIRITSSICRKGPLIVG